MSGVPQAGRPPGRRAALTLSTFFFIKNQKKKIGNSKTKKNQGNILVLLHFNQVIVLLWCSHYDINDGPEPAQTGGEN